MASASTTSGTAGTSGTGEWAWWPLKVAGSPWNVRDTMVAWGLWNYYDASDALTPLYAYICAAANPGGSFISGSNKYGYGHAIPTPAGLTGNNGTTAGAWEIFCEMCLRTRSVQFCESVIGDCGANVPIYTPNSAAQIGEQVAGVGASLIPIPGVGSVIGAAVGDLTGLLTGATHAQAVSTEKQTLCGLAAQYTALIGNAYSGFESGGLSASEFVAYMQQLASDFQQDVAKITKACNASCGMIGVLNAHAMFAQYVSGLKAMPVGLYSTPFIIAGTATPVPAASGLTGSDVTIGGTSSSALEPVGGSAAAAVTVSATATPAVTTGFTFSPVILLLLAIAVVLLVVL